MFPLDQPFDSQTGVLIVYIYNYVGWALINNRRPLTFGSPRVGGYGTDYETGHAVEPIIVRNRLKLDRHQSPFLRSRALRAYYGALTVG